MLSSEKPRRSPSTGNANPPGISYNNGKQDGFNLNVVKLTIEKPLDEGQWAAGYKADLLFGPDANQYATTSSGTSSSDFAIKQAYVQLRAPVGNGLDFKMGVFDTIVGYETFDSVNNPNYTRSYGYTIEPTTHTGLLATYQFHEGISASAGVANTMGPTINQRANPPRAESSKTYMGSIALTAPKDWGWMAGSVLYAGIVSGFSSTNVSGNLVHYYAGLTANTPVKEIKTGLAFDYAGSADAYAWTIAGYGSWQLGEKWSLHGRGEYEANSGGIWSGLPSKGFAATATLQYDLWKNVLSRLEFRWDHSATGADAYGGTVAGTPTLKNAYMLAANIVYKF